MWSHFYKRGKHKYPQICFRMQSPYIVNIWNTYAEYEENEERHFMILLNGYQISFSTERQKWDRPSKSSI